MTNTHTYMSDQQLAAWQHEYKSALDTYGQECLSDVFANVTRRHNLATRVFSLGASLELCRDAIVGDMDNARADARL